MILIHRRGASLQPKRRGSATDAPDDTDAGAAARFHGASSDRGIRRVAFGASPAYRQSRAAAASSDASTGVARTGFFRVEGINFSQIF